MGRSNFTGNRGSECGVAAGSSALHILRAEGGGLFRKKEQANVSLGLELWGQGRAELDLELRPAYRARFTECG